MSLNLMMNDDDELKPRITVFGVGGAGGNAVNNMIAKQLDGVEFVVANTDAQALQQSRANNRVQMGVKVTEGLGAGARPAVGASAAEESIEDIVDHLMGAHMCFITAGMGGGTGTGAAPIIAQAAREMGILTVGVVTKPFQFEGSKRMRQAEEGVEALQKVVDTLIIIPNQNLFRLANDRTTFTEAFAMADDVLYQGVKGVTDLMVRPGLINLDFADVRAVMDEMGKAMMGTGEASGEDRAKEAAERAIANPLLDEISLKGAKGVLINITGGYDLTLFELDEAANVIREQVDADANIIVGSTLDPDLEGSMRVSVVATGIDASRDESEAPVQRRGMTEPLTQNPTGTQGARQAAAEAEDPVPPRRESARNTDASVDGHVRGRAQADDADLPPPAYAPERRAVERAVVDQPVDTETFIAPQPPVQRKSPSEVQARLDRILHRDPQAAPATSRAQAPAQQASARETAESANRGRMAGLSKILERMTGHGEGADKPAGGASIAERVSSRMADAGLTSRHRPAETNYDDLDDRAGDSQDKVEIPAFLRRQAN
ncbi:cell division protein FtsZ [Paracoccus pacificus]|uniref:Cell division protein FtsZ n=1 Tax=Paracoccus pacificus TaxID=1463598 RepID=A0ABW4RBE1_9RHOB